MPRIKSSGPEPTYKPSTGHGHSGHFKPVADRHREPPLPSGQAAPKRESRSTDRHERRVLQHRDSSIRSRPQPGAGANGSADRDTRAPLCATTVPSTGDRDHNHNHNHNHKRSSTHLPRRSTSTIQTSLTHLAPRTSHLARRTNERTNAHWKSSDPNGAPQASRRPGGKPSILPPALFLSSLLFGPRLGPRPGTAAKPHPDRYRLNPCAASIPLRARAARSCSAPA
ncbi:hypothetical protein EC845_2768 [Comamonas sp. BIGb0124]|nr:hypothetical protein EC845_2768 [Comamonas sp. BIGb0124]